MKTRLVGIIAGVVAACAVGQVKGEFFSQDPQKNVYGLADHFRLEIVDKATYKITMTGTKQRIEAVSKAEGLNFTAQDGVVTVKSLGETKKRQEIDQAIFNGKVTMRRVLTEPQAKTQVLQANRLTYRTLASSAEVTLDGNVSIMDKLPNGQELLNVIGSRATINMLRPTPGSKAKELLKSATVTGNVKVEAVETQVDSDGQPATYVVTCGKMVLDKTSKPTKVTLTEKVLISRREAGSSDRGSVTKAKIAVLSLNEKGEVTGFTLEAE